MEYLNTPMLYWANPRAGKYIPVRVVAGSRPDQDGLINTDKGPIPESLLVKDVPDNRRDMAEHARIASKLSAESAMSLFKTRIRVMKLR